MKVLGDCRTGDHFRHHRPYDLPIQEGLSADFKLRSIQVVPAKAGAIGAQIWASTGRDLGRYLNRCYSWIYELEYFHEEQPDNKA